MDKSVVFGQLAGYFLAEHDLAIHKFVQRFILAARPATRWRYCLFQKHSLKCVCIFSPIKIGRATRSSPCKNISFSDYSLVLGVLVIIVTGHKCLCGGRSCGPERPALQEIPAIASCSPNEELSPVLSRQRRGCCSGCSGHGCRRWGRVRRGLRSMVRGRRVVGGRCRCVLAGIFHYHGLHLARGGRDGKVDTLTLSPLGAVISVNV